MLVQNPIRQRYWPGLEKGKNKNNNMNKGDLHKVVLNRSVSTSIKREVENVLVREYHCNLGDWSRNTWFVDFEQILELISRGIRHAIFSISPDIKCVLLGL